MEETEENKIISSRAAVVGSEPFVVVGIPANNEENTISRIIVQAQKHASKVVVVDDGSSDLTATIAERLGADVVRHGRNLGYGAAIQTLFKYALKLDADVLVTLDADGQHEPSEIPQVVKPILAGTADLVVGSRLMGNRSSSTIPWVRRAGVKFVTKLTNGTSGQNGVRDSQSGFRAYSRKVLDNLVLAEDGMGVSSEILINARKQGFKAQEVPTSCSYDRRLSTSSKNQVRHGMDVVGSIVKIVVEERPLTLLGLPGIIFLVAGVFFGVWMLQIYAVEHHIVTNVALASVAFILIGLFSVFTSIMLYAIARLMKRTRDQ